MKFEVHQINRTIRKVYFHISITHVYGYNLLSYAPKLKFLKLTTINAVHFSVPDIFDVTFNSKLKLLLRSFFFPLELKKLILSSLMLHENDYYFVS